MASLNQIGSKVMNYLRGGFQVDDNRFDWELVYDEIDKQRAVAIDEEFRRMRNMDAQFFQEVCCLKTECNPIICEGLESGDSEFSVTLPELLTVDGYTMIRYFGGTDKQSNYSEVTLQQNTVKDGLLYAKKGTTYVRIGNRAIIYNPPTCGLKYTCLVAILANPRNSGCSKLTENDPYPLPEKVIARVEYLTIMSLTGMLGLDPEQLNNARDDIRESFGYNRKQPKG